MRVKHDPTTPHIAYMARYRFCTDKHPLIATYMPLHCPFPKRELRRTESCSFNALKSLYPGGTNLPGWLGHNVQQVSYLRHGVRGRIHEELICLCLRSGGPIHRSGLSFPTYSPLRQPPAPVSLIEVENNGAQQQSLVTRAQAASS
jgi:hypothetical protein